MTDAPLGNSYDDVPYESYPFPQSHPNRLATIAALFGLRTPDLSKCRVLEMGCSSGGNLLPLAEQYAGCQLVGVDASPKAIAAGQEAIRAADLANARLHAMNILQVGPELGEFDYIVVHGVFSWVPREVQEKILAICAGLLAENGVAYVSYNTNPGWRLRGTIRDIMSYRASFFQRPEDKLHESRVLLDFLAASVPSEKNAYGILLTDELEHLRTKQDWYLFHEYLEDFNEPEYFHQFMERAQGHGLQYLGEADYSSMLASNFPQEVETTLRKLATDVIQVEQYMDLLRNRMFRQTLLCRQGIALERSVPPERIYPLYVASSAEPEQGPIDPRSWDMVTFRRPGSTLTTKEPLVKAAMLYLRQQWPRAAPFREVLAAARSRLQDGPVIVSADRDQRDAAALARPLLRCHATTHVDLYAYPDRASYETPERPYATRYARYQAKSSSQVTTLRHDSVRLGDLERHVLHHLDGERDLPQLIDAVAEDARAGRMLIQQNGRNVDEQEQVREVVARAVPGALHTICRKGLVASR